MCQALATGATSISRFGHNRLAMDEFPTEADRTTRTCRFSGLELHLIAMNPASSEPSNAVPNGTSQVTTLTRRSIVRVGSGLCYREMVNEGQFGSTGVQIIAPTLMPKEVEKLVKDGYIEDAPTLCQYSSSWTIPPRGTATITTDAASTTNYLHSPWHDRHSRHASVNPPSSCTYTEKYTVHAIRCVQAVAQELLTKPQISAYI